MTENSRGEMLMGGLLENREGEFALKTPREQAAKPQ
jgi:hypothetical protein